MKCVRLTVWMVAVLVLVACFDARADCWATVTYNCQYGGPQYYTCDDIQYPQLSFNNSGTYQAVAPASDGLDGTGGYNYTCSWSYTYYCDAALFTRSGSYPQPGSYAIGIHCMLALLDTPISIMLGVLGGVW